MGISFYTIDVGHGLCQVIRFGRRAILIDGGGKISKPIAEEFLKRYVDVIVAYVATHNDSDHVGAAPELLDIYPTKAKLNHIWLLFDRPAKKPEQSADEIIPLLAYARKRKQDETIDDWFPLYVEDIPAGCQAKIIHDEPAENAQLQLIYPKMKDGSSAFLRGRPNAEETNQSSAVLRLVVGGRKSKASALITGDANCRGFQQAREVYRFDLSARVISMPHHGGHIPVPEGAAKWDEIIDWVSPEIAVVSAGYSTVPGPTTTQRAAFDPLLRHGVKICCTQITRHCHPNFETLHPGIMTPRRYPQMSGHKDYPHAVGCAGTIAVKVNATGNVELFDHDRHQQEVNAKVVATGSHPHCR